MKLASHRGRPLLRRIGAALLGGAMLSLVLPFPQVGSGQQRPREAAERFTKVARTLPNVPTSAEPSSEVTAPNPTPGPRLVPPRSPDPPAPRACPADMVLVSGQYCPKVKHHCLEWLDDETLPFARCGRYAREAECLGERSELRFCIDRFESAGPDGMPVNHQSFALAKQRCAAMGRRLCLEDEWNFACEGEEMLPYPYGLSREAKCNQDRTDLYERKAGGGLALKDLRQRNDAASECISPFGVYNLVGNVDEPVIRARGRQPRFNNALKGGWWMAGRNRCRPATTAHDDYYRDVQIGVRCCADAGS